MPNSVPQTSTDGTAERGDLLLRVSPGAGEMNSSGQAFGGWLMGQMDKAASIFAGWRTRGRVATVSVKNFDFLAPVRVDEVLSIHGAVTRIGRTSITVDVIAWSRPFDCETETQVVQAQFVLVAVDATGRPREIREA